MVQEYPAYDGVVSTLTADPIRFAGECRPAPPPAAHLGEHTAAVLADWCGYAPDEVAELAAEGAVGIG
jgi:crotonobetainyl-CoA:carnitine CoA-transferase CaiB-like acyl-CoA transferase